MAFSYDRDNIYSTLPIPDGILCFKNPSQFKIDKKGQNIKKNYQFIKFLKSENRKEK